MLALFAILIVLGIVAIFFSEIGEIMMAQLRPGSKADDDVSIPVLIFPGVRDTPPMVALPVVRGSAARASKQSTPAAEVLAPSTIVGSAPLADVSDGATVVFRRPADEPMQLLPGRLELLAGEHGCKEIRLVSTLGEHPKIVVGRATGPPHRYITLHSPTVSRQHAELEFADGRWTIANLSETNPVLVNDTPMAFSGPGLGAYGGTRTRFLSDGDRIALGDVLLRFHAR